MGSINMRIRSVVRLLVGIFAIGIPLIGAVSAFAQDLSILRQSADSSRAADGLLNDVCAVSVDKAWCAGDRGLILGTENGGKTWTLQTKRSRYDLFGIEFLDDENGWAVGGWIEPYSLRSRGTILTTSDGGQNWTATTPLGVPRLVGIQVLGFDHLIAWGDWSDAMQSSLFESVDGGRTWSSRPIPCGHLQSAATNPQGQTVLVDRAGRVFRSADGVDFNAVVLPVTVPSPIKFCRWTPEGWWLGGINGRLFRSVDSKEWIQIQLPGDEDDHRLLCLNDVAFSPSNVWVVGQPGSVVWNSRDVGRTWTVQQTRSSPHLNSIASVDDNVLFACGPMATILGSRNGGQAWWAQHRSGSRTGLLSFATTIDTVPWDILTFTTHESNRQAACVVVHDRELEQRLGNRPENASRLSSAGSLLRIATAKTLVQYPVGWLYHGYRASDLSYYKNETAGPARQKNPLLRQLVQEIRTQMPDVITVDSSNGDNPLQSANAALMDLAIRLSSDNEYKLYSPQSGIQNMAWATPRTLIRDRRSGGLNYPAAMVLKKSATVLESQLSIVRGLIPQEDTWVDAIVPPSEFYYRLPQQKGSQLLHPFESLILDSSTERTEKISSGFKLNDLISVSQFYDNLNELVRTPGNQLVMDTVWNDKLNRLIKEARGEILLPSLLSAAEVARRAGYWNRWQVILEAVLTKEKEGYFAEAAFRELMTHYGSVEIQCMMDQILEQNATPGTPQMDSNERTTWQQSSPFSRPVSVEPSVQRANFQSTAKLTTIARGRGIEEFTRLLSRWPNEWQVQRSDPQWAWLIASRYRTAQLNKGLDESDVQRQQAVYWPPRSQMLATWNQVSKEERAMLDYWVSPKKPDETTRGVTNLEFARARPFLDGQGDEAFWNHATTVSLMDPWIDDPDGKTILRMARDNEFLYVHCRCKRSRFNALSDSVSERTSDPKLSARKRDSADLNGEHIRLRIDLDRDYATWFEFIWDSRGATLDQCSNLQQWNPTWYIATQSDPDYWQAEIAIPLASMLPRQTMKSSDQEGSAVASDSVAGELTSAEPRNETLRGEWLNRCWAISAIHTIPSESTRKMPNMISDRLKFDQWMIIDPLIR